MLAVHRVVEDVGVVEGEVEVAVGAVVGGRKGRAPMS